MGFETETKESEKAITDPKYYYINPSAIKKEYENFDLPGH
jgi:hypothetical protein